MKTLLTACTLILGLLAGPTVQAQTRLPQRDLTVEVRQVEDGQENGQEEGASYRAGPQSAALLTAQKVQVRNGEKATLRMHQSVPMQWVQSVQAPSKQSGAGVSQSLHWFDAGQTLVVLPRWPGGRREVVVELDVRQASLQDGTNANLPSQGQSQWVSTVTVPLDRWVTVAASGNPAPPKGSYSSEAASSPRRLLQVRVQLP